MSIGQGVLSRITQGQTFALALLVFVLVPQVVALIADATDFFPKEAVLATRFMAVAALFYCPLHIVIRGMLDRGFSFFIKSSAAYIFALCFMMACLILLSLTVNHAPLYEFLRGGVFLAYIVTILIFAPMALRLVDVAGFLRVLGGGFIILSFALIGLALIWRLQGLGMNSRFGFPLSPGVFACYMMTAWAVSYSVFRSRYLAILFFLMVVAAGSRSAIAITVFLYLVAQYDFSLARIREMSRGALVVLAGLVLLQGMDTNIYRPYMVERADLFSGRAEIWEKSLEQMGVKDYLFGQGQEVRIVKKNGARVGAHNSFLNLAMFYGLPFVTLTLVAWFARFRPIGVIGFFRPKSGLALLQQQLFVMITLKSLISNIFWTNMADAATLTGCLVLLLPHEGKEGGVA